MNPIRKPVPTPRWRIGFLLLVVTTGCHKGTPPGEPIAVAPAVRLVKPQRRDLHHTVGQPGYIYAYEQTSLYPKIAGYIEKWYVDIGKPLKKGELLADLYVPELHARYREKKAQVVLSEEQVRQAERLVEVASSNVQVASADVLQARADVQKYEADVERWESEVKRLAGLSRIVDVQVLEESKKQLKTATASRSASAAAVKAAEARELARKADLAKARVDVAVARARVQVDKAAEEDLAALVGYTHLHAPYDGIVITRNANTGDYVEPRYGDESAPRAGYASEVSTHGTPIYVVARTDLVRVFVDVPEMEAQYVKRGTPAHVRVQALDDADIPGTVARTSWALDFRSRTLRAEIDLPNDGARLLPGMYAFGEVEIERKNVLSLPKGAVVESGNENVCYLHEEGRAVRTPVQVGIRTDQWVEVFRKKVHGKWVEFSGNEEVLLGDLGDLRDGEKVRVSPAPGDAGKR